jgi:hypothetical protein
MESSDIAATERTVRSKKEHRSASLSAGLTTLFCMLFFGSFFTVFAIEGILNLPLILFVSGLLCVYGFVGFGNILEWAYPNMRDPRSHTKKEQFLVWCCALQIPAAALLLLAALVVWIFG